ncbi:MAG: DUF1905 domain-containing protein [Solirubrobacterales bacterium]|nr:DUF1905 domain-containing protein [Solirubrobacterales bacterium]
MGTLTFTAELVGRGPAAAIVLDDVQVHELGEGAKRFPVRATINGHELRLSVARMRGEFLVGLSKANREAAGVAAGDRIEVTLALDVAPREVTVPPALEAALQADAQARARFEELAFTHRKEFVRWIEEAKRDETRERRIARALEMLHAGRTRS